MRAVYQIIVDTMYHSLPPRPLCVLVYWHAWRTEYIGPEQSANWLESIALAGLRAVCWSFAFDARDGQGLVYRDYDVPYIEKYLKRGLVSTTSLTCPTVQYVRTAGARSRSSVLGVRGGVRGHLQPAAGRPEREPPPAGAARAAAVKGSARSHFRLRIPISSAPRLYILQSSPLGDDTRRDQLLRWAIQSVLVLQNVPLFDSFRGTFASRREVAVGAPAAEPAAARSSAAPAWAQSQQAWGPQGGGPRGAAPERGERPPPVGFSIRSFTVVSKFNSEAVDFETTGLMWDP